MAQLYAIFSLAYVWSLIHRKLFPLASAFSLLFVLALAVGVGFFYLLAVCFWGFFDWFFFVCCLGESVCVLFRAFLLVFLLLLLRGLLFWGFFSFGVF